MLNVKHNVNIKFKFSVTPYNIMQVKSTQITHTNVKRQQHYIMSHSLNIGDYENIFYIYT